MIESLPWEKEESPVFIFCGIVLIIVGILIITGVWINLDDRFQLWEQIGLSVIASFLFLLGCHFLWFVHKLLQLPDSETRSI